MTERLANELARLFRAEAAIAKNDDECERLHGIADDLEVRALRDLLAEESEHSLFALG